MSDEKIFKIKGIIYSECECCNVFLLENGEKIPQHRIKEVLIKLK